MEELFKTEFEIYQPGLCALVENFMPCFERHGEDPAKLFPNIEAIKELHSSLLPPSLQVGESKEAAASNLAAAFVKWAATARVFYAQFCKCQTSAVEKQLAACAASEALATEVAVIEQKLRRRGLRVWQLSGLMSTPFQRLLRYPMLFAEVAKEVQGSRADEPAAAALAAVQALARHCEEERHREELRGALVGCVLKRELSKLIEPPRRRLSGTFSSNDGGDGDGASGLGGLGSGLELARTASGAAASGRLARLLLRTECRVKLVYPEAPWKTWWHAAEQPATLLLLSDRLAFVARGGVLDQFTLPLEVLLPGGWHPPPPPPPPPPAAPAASAAPGEPAPADAPPPPLIFPGPEVCRVAHHPPRHPSHHPTPPATPRTTLSATLPPTLPAALPATPPAATCSS